MTRLIHYLPTTARRVLILANPTAGARANAARVERLCELLGRSGLLVETVSALDELTRAVGAAGDPSIRAVVAAGGDGTVTAVLNATPPETPIAVLPLGTENLLAKYLEYPLDVGDLAHTIVHGASVAIDAGDVNGRLFLLMVGCGFDAHVVRQVHLARRGHIRHATYVKPILQSIRRYQYPQMRVAWEPPAVVANACGPRDAERTSALAATWQARWVFVVNIPRYAGGLQLLPEARGDDGLLDACLLQRGSLMHGLRYLAGILRGTHQAWPDCRRLTTARIRIEADGEVPYQLDGDPGGVLPVEIAIVPGRLRALVAPSWALQHGYVHARGKTV
jgi:diacylglycerol kinase (ATP)